VGFWNWINTPAGPPVPVAAHSTLAELIVADALQNGNSSREAALAVAAVFRSRQLNADTVASLPLKAGDTLVPAPNDDQDVQQVVAETILALQDFGDAYWRITPDGDLRVIPNRDVHVSWDTNRTNRIYQYRNSSILRYTGPVPNLKVVTVNRSADDLTGTGWMESGRIQGVISEQEYSQTYFEHSGNPTGVLSTPGTLTGAEAKLLKDQWVNARNGARTPAVLSGGMQWDSTSFSPQESQWVETHLTGIGDIATLSGVPAYFLSYAPRGSSLTYSNTSDLWRVYWSQTLKPTYATRIEKAWSEVTGTLVTFDPEQLLVASLTDRVYGAGELVRGGFDPASALETVGLPPMANDGLTPTTLIPENRETNSASRV